ncbi:MAG: HD domain-containing protein [Lachnospiraceae bacterium]|nr:HD domain-containing protein [Lachnospiraceae bacterium]
MIIQIPEDVKYILEKLNNAGYEAYAVGGCVRDSILGRTPDDWDITTSAKPEETKALFPKTIDTGIQHGTVTVMKNHVGYEVTTYRIDGEYEDSRHPKEVIFTSDLLEDLKRRDFTINAMAYNHLAENQIENDIEKDIETTKGRFKSGLVDAFGGIEDIENKIIRCVGNPIHRFEEDALRMMRAVRFSAQLGYEIETETENAIKVLAGNLVNISAERIQVELVKLLVSDHPDYLRTAYETGMTKVFFPEFDKMMETDQNNPHHIYSVGEHTLHALIQIRNDKVLRLSMLLHDIGKPESLQKDETGRDHFHGHPELGEEMARKILRRLRFDNDTISKVCKLVKFHDQKLSLKPTKLRKAIVKIGPELFPLLLEVKEADMMAQSDYKRDEKERELEEIRKVYTKILEDKDCLCLKDLAVCGKDLIEQGMKPGKELGETLQKLFEYVLENPEKNNRENLIEYLNVIKKNTL